MEVQNLDIVAVMLCPYRHIGKIKKIELMD
jgi:hypothetical protein